MNTPSQLTASELEQISTAISPIASEQNDIFEYLNRIDDEIETLARRISPVTCMGQLPSKCPESPTPAHERSIVGGASQTPRPVCEMEAWLADVRRSLAARVTDLRELNANIQL